MAQLVQHLPRTQKIAGSSPARGSSSFSLDKKELSSGVVACICLVSITDYSCTLYVNSLEQSDDPHMHTTGTSMPAVLVLHVHVHTYSTGHNM